MFQPFYFQNLFRMFHYQLLSDIEQTFNILEYCVIVDLRLRQIIRHKMDGGSISIHLFCVLASRNLSRSLTFPTSFAGGGKSWSCIDGSCISCSDTLVLTHATHVSLCNWGYNILSHHRVFGVAPPLSCFQRPLEHSLVDSLEITRRLILKRIFNCFQGLFPLLFFDRYSPD